MYDFGPAVAYKLQLQYLLRLEMNVMDKKNTLAPNIIELKF